MVVDVGAPDADCCHTSAGVGAADAADQILLATINMTTNIRSWPYLCSLMVVLQRKSANFLDGPMRNGINRAGSYWVYDEYKTTDAQLPPFFVVLTKNTI